MLTEENLRPYQRRAAKFVYETWFAGLLIDMGLGKTIIVLSALVQLFRKGKINRVLIVGPKRVVEGVWRQEAKKWQHTRKMTFKLLTGPEPKRLIAMQSQAQVHLINAENLRWLLYVVKTQMRRNGNPYDMLVIDESSMFKSVTAKRFMSIRPRLHWFKRRLIMTGTFAPKGLLDIWTQMYILDEGQRLGENIERYRSQFFSPGGYRAKGYEPDEGAEAKILERISDLCLTMRAEDYLDLPPTVVDEVWVDLPPKARSVYERLEEEMFLELEMGSTAALSPASLSSKCWQIANGALYLQDQAGARTWQAIHDAKLEALDEVVEGESSNLLVAYWFKPDLARLKAKYPKAINFAEARNDRELNLMQDQWNAGKHRVAFVHPASTGHGLSLQGGGNAIAFYSMLWSREYYAQVIERIGAARQVNTGRDMVRVHHIVARATVDEVMLRTQRTRLTDERRIVKLLRDYRAIKEALYG